MSTTPSATEPQTLKPDRRALRILARSIARDLDAQGYQARVLLVLASELIDEAAQRIRAQRPPAP